MLDDGPMMSVAFIGFGVLSMFGMILLEIFSALFVYQITGSLTITYATVAIQLVAETGLTYALPGLLRRLGPAWLLLLSVPFRMAAFALLLSPSPSLTAIFGASLLISVSSTASEVPRGVLLAAVTASKARGLNLGLFEALRYVALAMAPLLGGYAYDLGGFGWVAALSTGVSLVAAALATKVQRELRAQEADREPSSPPHLIVPWPVRVLWWSTGVRYLGENCLYPLMALLLYASTVRLGWIAALTAVAGIAFGALTDRVRGDGLLVLALATLAVGWILRSQPILFETALIAGIICAVGGKAAGILEKKASYDFGDIYHNNVHYIGRREREMLLARTVILIPCAILVLDPTAAIIAVAIVLVGNISVIAVLQLLMRNRKQHGP